MNYTQSKLKIYLNFSRVTKTRIYYIFSNANILNIESLISYNNGKAHFSSLMLAFINNHETSVLWQIHLRVINWVTSKLLIIKITVHQGRYSICNTAIIIIIIINISSSYLSNTTIIVTIKMIPQSTLNTTTYC